MRNLYIPLAILIGSIIISIGVYLGLSSRVPEPSRSAQSAAAVVAQPALALPSQEQLLRQVGAAIDAARPALQKACPQKSGATPDRLVLTISFNAAGREIGRGLAEMSGNPHPNLNLCLVGALPKLTIPPPGDYVTVDAPFVYP